MPPLKKSDRRCYGMDSEGDHGLPYVHVNGKREDAWRTAQAD